MNPAYSSQFNWQNRLVGLMFFLPCAVVLGIASWFTPDGDGYGTHTQLGLAPCGFVARTGMPCATCGMTTSFAYAADGNIVRSFITQPAGATLATITAMISLLSGYALVTGINLLPVFRMVWQPKLIVIFGVVVIGAWIYKIVTFEGFHA